mmetsp:Transcript_18324/g.28293  ORF Transcript_18324/g.28293 Transcript_18324/m.28293 type:complete len:369 (+) Transcript_18324:72-1178(+)
MKNRKPCQRGSQRCWTLSQWISLALLFSSPCYGHDMKQRCDLNIFAQSRACSTFVASDKIRGKLKRERLLPSRRFLFFRKAEKPVIKRRTWNVPEVAADELCAGESEFPCKIELEYDEGATIASKSTKDMGRTLTLRNLEVEDLPAIMPMCIREFANGETAGIADFPLDDLKLSSILDWFDKLMFEPVVGLAMRLKIQRRKQGEDPNDSAIPDDNILCLLQDDQIVGIIELSRQPPDAERNPPPYPVPMFYKELICEAKDIPMPVAWVTNLLIDDNYRGLGYGKLLMFAVEGLARKWGLQSIYLHTVADSVSGVVPQSLYFGMGYKPVESSKSLEQYSWMGPEHMNINGLCIVEGVPLLFLKKDLCSN